MSKMDFEKRECYHGLACVIVTQTKPNHKKFGKSVYMCGSADKCAFREETEIPLQTCDFHKSYVKVRSFREERGMNPIIYYHCAAATGSEWCGSWETVSEEGKENIFPNEEAITKEAEQNNGRRSIEEYASESSGTEEDTNATNDQSITEDDSRSELENESSSNVQDMDADSNDSECYNNTGISEQDRTGDSENSDESDCDGEKEEDDSYKEDSDVGEADDVSTCGDETGDESGLVREEEEERCDELDLPLNDNNEGCGHGAELQSQSPKPGDTPPKYREDEGYRDCEEEGCRPIVSEPISLNYRDTPCVEVSSESDSEHGDVGESSEDEERDSSPTMGGARSNDSTHLSASTTVNDRPHNSSPASSTDHHQGEESTDSAVIIDEVETEDEKRAEFKVGTQFRKLVKQLLDHQLLIAKYGPNLPDGGARLREQERMIKQRMIKLRGYVPGKEEMLEFLNKPVEQEEGEEERVPTKQKFHSSAMHGYAKELTHGAIQHLHSSLESCPTEDTLADSPEELTVTLMDHQRRALAWLRWREEQIPRGGILADDMGLGKTLSMISLILTQREKATPPHRGEASGLMRSRATLVVVPLTLLDMWDMEIGNKLDPHTLSVLIYHGPKRTKYPQDLVYYDVVITTYNIVGTEAAPLVEQEKKKKSRRTAASDTLFRVHWNRIVLDEGHNIRNPKTATSIGCCALKADHRWVMTGTPIQNKLEDFYSLIKFLRLSPFDDLRVWRDTIGNRSTLGMQRLKAMVSSLVLRRTKEEMMEIKVIDLPQKSLKVHEIELDKMEKEIYEVLFHEGRGFFQRYLVEQGEDVYEDHTQTQELLDKLPPNVALAVKRILGSVIKEDAMMERSSKGRTVLVLLLRLRQACSHLNLLCSALESDPMAGELELALAMEAISLNHQEEQHPKIFDVPEEFNKRRPSAKIKEIIKTMEEVFSSQEENGKPNKCIIVSQWTSMFNVLEYHLNKRGISFTRIDGKVPARERQSHVTLFNSPRANPRVMLLSLQAGGVGLTLTGANHVFIIDLHWNPQLEQQASDRCHRVGQTRDVVVHRFVVKDTVEVGIQAIQQKKLQLAQDVLSVADKKKRRANFGLTLADLKQLFDI